MMPERQIIEIKPKEEVRLLEESSKLENFNEGPEDEFPFFPAMWNQNQLEANDLEEELNSILGQKIWFIFLKISHS